MIIDYPAAAANGTGFDLPRIGVLAAAVAFMARVVIASVALEIEYSFSFTGRAFLMCQRTHGSRINSGTLTKCALHTKRAGTGYIVVFLFPVFILPFVVHLTSSFVVELVIEK